MLHNLLNISEFGWKDRQTVNITLQAGLNLVQFTSRVKINVFKMYIDISELIYAFPIILCNTSNGNINVVYKVVEYANVSCCLLVANGLWAILFYLEMTDLTDSLYQ